MAADDASTVYLSVIRHVVSNARPLFILHRHADALLRLHALWKMKMLRCGAIHRADGPSATPPPVLDLNMPDEDDSSGEFEALIAEMFSPRTPPPETDDTGPSNYVPSPFTSARKPPPSPWTNCRPLGVDVNVACFRGREEQDRGAPPQPLTKELLMMSSGKRKRDEYPGLAPPDFYVPQQDDSADMTFEFDPPESDEDDWNSFWDMQEAANKKPSSKETTSTLVLPQRDGIQNDNNDSSHFLPVATENTSGEAAEYQAQTPAVGTPKPKSDTGDDDEPPLNEDDDLEQGEEEPDTKHLVLALFDKVTRKKNQWKCTLKNGIMYLNGRDVLFNEARGEFDF